MEETTIYMYTNSGESLGILPYDSAEHVEDLGGTDKLTVTTERWVPKRSRLVWQDNAGDWHEHMADNPKRNHAGARAATKISCSNSISELYGAQASGTKLKGTVHDILAALVDGTRWAVGGCSDFGTIELEVWHKNVRECIAELCEQVGGEMLTAIDMGQNAVRGRYVRIVEQRGATTVRRQFSYGRNIGSASREVGADEVYTAIVGYGAKIDAEDDSDYAARITTMVETGADLTQWGIPKGDGTFAHSIMTYTDNACTSKAFLTKQCTQMAKVYGKPVLCYIFDISEVDDALWSDVRLGNMVMCVDDTFSPPLELIERVSRIKRKLKGRISCTVEIGRRSNPLVERFRAVEKTAKKTTGNGSRVGSYGSVSTGGEYSGGSFQASVESMPTSLKITTPPTKTEYFAGAPMDYSGIVCTLYDATSQVYTDEWYPDGTVPFNELIFPVEIASMDNPASVGEYNGADVVFRWPATQFHTGGGRGTITAPIKYGEYELPYVENPLRDDYWGGDGLVIGRTPEGGIIELNGMFEDRDGATIRACIFTAYLGDSLVDYIVISSESYSNTIHMTVFLPNGQKDERDRTHIAHSNIVDNSYEASNPSYSGSVWVMDLRGQAYEGNHWFLPRTSDQLGAEGDYNPNYPAAVGLFIQYGEGFETQPVSSDGIPVYWTRSDGEQLSDTFQITVISGGAWGGGDPVDGDPSSSGGGKF